MDTITAEDLRRFGIQLIGEIKDLLQASNVMPAGEQLPAWIKSAAVRKRLNISPGTLQNLRISGKIKFQRIGGSYYYKREDLDLLFQTASGKEY